MKTWVLVCQSYNDDIVWTLFPKLDRLSVDPVVSGKGDLSHVEVSFSTAPINYAVQLGGASTLSTKQKQALRALVATFEDEEL